MESNYPHDNPRGNNHNSISKYCPNISLINSKIDSDTGNTPLILALLSKDINSFTKLLSLNASPDVPNNEGNTPLHISVLNNNFNFLLLLLQNNADCNIRNKEGNTPLHLAVIKKEKNIIQTLLKNGANPNFKNNLGQTPMHLAIMNKMDKSLIKTCKEKGGDFYFIKDNFNKTGFDYAKDLEDIDYENNLINIFEKNNNN